MPPKTQAPPRKEACILIVDVGRSMGESPSDDGSRPSGLDNAKHALQLMIQQKLLFTKQDELGIILLGTDETQNELNEEDPESYQHISVFQPLQKPDLKLLESINSIEPSTSRRGDAIDAVLVAMQILHARVGKLRFQKRIFLVTDAAAPILDDPAALELIEEGMRRDEFKLNVIGIGFSEDDEDDEDGGVKKKEEDGGDEMEERKYGDAAAAALSSSRPPTVKKEAMRTETQRVNEAILKRFARNVEGIVFSAHSAIQVLSEFRSRSVNQVTKFRGIMELGTQHFNVWAYSKTAIQNMPTLKKQSVLAASASSVMGEEEKESGGGGGWRGGGEDDDDEGGGFGGADTGDSRIQMERTYLNKRGEREKEVKPEMRIKSFRYGKEQVPFSDEDLEQLKYQTEKGIKILSFVPQRAIPRHHYMSSVDCIVAEPGDYSSALALSALIHALYDSAKVAVIRYVKRANAAPLLGILIPVVKPDVECFYFNQLPFEEDIREYPFAGLDDVKITSNQKQAALDLVRSMNLMTAGRDEDGEPTEALVPKYTFNPVLQRFYQCVERRALDPNADISELDPEIAKYIIPDESLLRQAAPKLNNFKNAFSLKLVEKQEKKKRNWKDWYSSEVQDSDIEAVRKKMKQGEEAGAVVGNPGDSPMLDSRQSSTFSLDSALAPQVEKVGAVNPIQDFNTLLQRRDDASIITRAMDEMSARIQDFVLQSYRGNWYDKAIECLKALRSGCVLMEESTKFNTLLMELKQAHAPTPAKPKQAHMEFWARLQLANILPISDAEVSDSKLSEAEAAKFYETDFSAPISAPSVQAPPSDEADLFDSME